MVLSVLRDDPNAPPARGKGSSIFETDTNARDDLRYWEKKLSDPINTAEDKWRLVPAFLQTKGLVKQHLDSFNYFIEKDMRNIMMSTQRVESDVDPHFFLKFTDIYVRRPEAHDTQSGTTYPLTPQECRLRDITYAGTVFVNVEYVRGKQIVRKTGIEICRMPIMLKSCRCVLTNKSAEDVAKLGECPIDPGGYFIVRGTEKVILIQEQLSKNRIIVDTDRMGLITASVTSSTTFQKSKTNVTYGKTGRLVLKHNSIGVDMPVVIIMKALGIQSDKEMVELICGRDPDFLNLFAPSLEDHYKDKEGKGIFTQLQALEHIGSKVKQSGKPFVGKRDYIEDGREVLAISVLSHVPVETVHGQLNFRPKAIYLALMVRRILQAVKDGGIVDDRDFVGNKRLELAGALLSLLFEDLFKSWISNVKMTIDKQLDKKNRTSQYDPVTTLTQTSRFITDGLFRAISSGNWNVKRFKMERSGVTQVLTRLSYVSALGMLTRINSQFEKTRKVSGPRSLQTSQFGMYCTSDTPEGEGCGLIKNLALLAHITTDAEEEPVRRLMFILGVEDINLVNGTDLHGDPNTFLAFLNGVIIGVHRNPVKFVTDFRKLRRAGRVGALVSVYSNPANRTLNISSDGGRVCRPLIIVEKGKPRIKPHDVRDIIQGLRTFEDLVKEGKVEFVDVNEEGDCNIAVYEDMIIYDPGETRRLAEARANILKKLRRREYMQALGYDVASDPSLNIHESDMVVPHNTTHLEISTLTVFGAVAGLIPYPHHNQSPRNTYQCAMGKQAIGAIAYNQLTRIDTLIYLMVYPMHPMVRTRTIELIGFDRIPAGQNATVAVMSYSGYDIEDALVMNKASLDRGFGRCQVLRKHAAMIKSHPNRTFDRIADPKIDARTGELREDYDALDDDGIAAPGEVLQTKYVVINKQTPVETAPRIESGSGGAMAMNPLEVTYKEDPVKFKYPGPGVVDQVAVTTNEEDQLIIKANIRQTRRPELGDKFSSRHGQKGVVGNIVSYEDFPFNDQGVSPDIIMNPHGFPSRMTVGKMIELLAGKAGLFCGKVQYGTLFGGSKVDDMSKILIDNGFNYSGKDMLTSGITGEPLSAYIFFGPIYYQKLKHMVMDKMHARAKGPRAVLTRQPTEGRSRDGGLRVGEMERDCLIGHGASSLLIERLLYSSDAYDVEVCRECGLVGAWHGSCKYCEGRGGVVVVKMPYACKLLFQEMMSMNVVPRVKVEEWE
ncbi:hypothetical protein BJ742DRAFT_762479 [Cladochytrium replicatum]|nr:hypothetical protein BJ742DRAFT_762479 [Cladochytrium replicatum]